MENLTLILVLCISVPVAILCIFLEPKARKICLFLITGMLVAIVAEQFNTALFQIIKKSPYYLTTNVTPVVEETLKAVPIIMYGFGFKTNRQTLLSLAMAVGVGFALVENCYILINNLSAATIGWAVLRVLGASVMHGICTGIVGWGVSYVKTRKKLFYTGTFALLIMAIIAHGIFNSLIQSNIYILAVLCVLTATFCFAVAIRADHIKWKRS